MNQTPSENTCRQCSDGDVSGEVEVSRVSCRLRSTDFIRKNIREASKVRRIEYDTDEMDNCSINSKRSSRSSGISSPNSKTKNTRLSLDDSLHKANWERNYRANQRRIESPKIPIIQESQEGTESPKKSYIKQTTCQACKEKWRTPLPTPKTPKIKKASVLPVENQLCKTDSRNRIRLLIHKELYTLESYNKRYSSSNSSARSSIQKDEIASDPTDYVKLDLLEVAKNKLEEREKETKKKLDEFLNGSLT